MYGFPSDIYPVVIEDFVNDEHAYSIRNDSIEENNIEVNDKVR